MRIRLASDKGRKVAKYMCLPYRVHPISIFITATNRDGACYRADHRDSSRILYCIPTDIQSSPAHHMDVLGGA